MMKITTWNVNGIRAWLRKERWDWIESFGPDVLCLQEIKARPDQLTEEQHALFSDYQVAWHPAERPGYSGVATFSNSEVMSTKDLGNKKFDVEGRVVQSNFGDFVLFNCYVPNGARDHGRLTYKLDFYDSLLSVCDSLHKEGKSVIICGDLNTAHQEIDLKNWKQNKKTSGFLPEERSWIDKYLEHGFVDVFRQRYPEKVKYTWWSYRRGVRERNIGWRLDYFLVSENLLPKINDVIVHDDILGSDHCPVTLVLD